MSVSGIEGVQATAATGYLPTEDAGTAGSGGEAFGTSLTGALTNLQALQSESGVLSVKAATGNLDDIHQATIAATRAQVTLELVSTLRSKGVDAFNEIMRMQA
ncbi:flagellar hook-basal body protein FliE (plasmid) [Arthrobacter sp. ERGS1:01]|uniref:flagellar hook-basal body complex protein FliE n=1 Tax=Arthrobacter sp. ERGS1:01 TaxID=1704044 RepID=UPI0006B55E97|nr:flagellar hook-basal body complex protein FliE [Arthrobacter sp. ERGS1:01]ALE04203.1 flagellar hook-basal body protein FliE [Arthrobacter sp. ERGS1:01]